MNYSTYICARMSIWICICDYRAITDKEEKINLSNLIHLFFHFSLSGSFSLATFIQFDIIDFYPSITKNLLIDSINYARKYIDITNEQYQSSKTELGRISKCIIQNIVNSVKKANHCNLWANSYETIEWFRGIKNKSKATFIQFDIIDFYPSITKIF